MSKQKNENDSNEAPPSVAKGPKELPNDYFTICPECSSSIEILSIKEEKNIIEFKCLKTKKYYILSIKEYLKQVKEKKDKNINELKDKCEKHNDNNYICYCFDCKSHLCEFCLKERTHIYHKKANIIEIKPNEKELNIVDKVIENYQNKLEDLKKEKENKTKEIENKLNKEKAQEKNILNKKIKLNKNKIEKELEENNNNYITDMEKIKRKYEEEMKLIKDKYEIQNSNIYNKYKLKNEKIKVKYDIKIEKLTKKYKDEISGYQFDEKIEDTENKLKLNEIIFNIYNNYNNNYYNSININSLLMYYIKDKEINDKIMKDILNKDYENILKKVKQKTNEDIKLKLLKEEIDNKQNEINNQLIKFKEENEKLEEKCKEELIALEKKVSKIILFK